MSACNEVVLLIMLVPALVCVVGVWLMLHEHKERARNHMRRREDRRAG